MIPFEANCAREYGSLKAGLRRIGRPTGSVDALIAAMALAHSAVLVTHNTAHYESIPGLRLEDWLA